jgi:hypothetical protein
MTQRFNHNGTNHRGRSPVSRYYNPPDPNPEPPRNDTETLLATLIAATRMVHYALDPILPLASGPEVRVHVIHVVTAGTPVSAPDIEIVPGIMVIIRQRHHGTQRTGYVSFEGPSGTVSTLTRIEMQDNDTMVQKLTSLEDLAFDANADNTYFEIIFRQSRRTNLGSWEPEYGQTNA